MTLNPRKGYRERQVHKAQTHGLESKPERAREPVQVAVRETDMNYKEKVHWLSRNKLGMGGRGLKADVRARSPHHHKKAKPTTPQSVCSLPLLCSLSLPLSTPLPTKHMLVQGSGLQGPQKNSIGLNVNATQSLKASAAEGPGA